MGNVNHETYSKSEFGKEREPIQPEKVRFEGYFEYVAKYSQGRYKFILVILWWCNKNKYIYQKDRLKLR